MTADITSEYCCRLGYLSQHNTHTFSSCELNTKQQFTINNNTDVRLWKY